MSAFKNGWTKALILAQNAEQKLQTGKEIYQRILTTKLLEDKDLEGCNHNICHRDAIAFSNPGGLAAMWWA